MTRERGQDRIVVGPWGRAVFYARDSSLPSSLYGLAVAHIDWELGDLGLCLSYHPPGFRRLCSFKDSPQPLSVCPTHITPSTLSPLSTNSSPGYFLSPCNLLFPLGFFILQVRGQWVWAVPEPLTDHPWGFEAALTPVCCWQLGNEKTCLPSYTVLHRCLFYRNESIL